MPANRVPPRIRHDERPLSQRGMRQPSLLDAPAKADMAFIAYHHAHPEVFAAFRTIALRLLQRGVTHYGAAYLSLAREELAAAYHWLSLACDGRADWHEAFDAHREQVYQALTAIEAELEVLP